MRKPTPATLHRIADSLDPIDGAPRISGLRVRPPVVSESDYALSSARGEPSDFRPVDLGGLVISRPVTDDVACQQLAARLESPRSGYVEHAAGLPKDAPAWLKREALLVEQDFEHGLSASEQEIMQRRAVAEWQRENGV